MSSRQSGATKVQFDNTNSDGSHVALTRLVPCGSRLVCVCQWISKTIFEIFSGKPSTTRLTYVDFSPFGRRPLVRNGTNDGLSLLGSTSISLPNLSCSGSGEGVARGQKGCHVLKFVYTILWYSILFSLSD